MCGNVCLMPSPHLVNLVQLHLFVYCCHGPLDGSPEGGIASVGLVLVVECEQPGIANSAVIESSGHIVP